MEQFRELTDAYFAGRNRMHEFVERGEGAPGASVPVVYLNSDSSEEKEWFCADVVNWLLYSMRELPYEGNEAIYASVEIDYWGERFSYIFSNLETLAEDHTAAVYNDLYAFIEEIQQEVYRQRMTLNKEGGDWEIVRPYPCIQRRKTGRRHADRSFLRRPYNII
jgi:hypothetical protein